MVDDPRETPDQPEVPPDSPGEQPIPLPDETPKN
jgi:hypothetical protein